MLGPSRPLLATASRCLMFDTALLAKIHRHSRAVALTVQTPSGQTMLRCDLPMPLMHPRGLLDLLEAVARFSGTTVNIVVFVPDLCRTMFDDGHWTDQFQWGPSASVHVIWVHASDRRLPLQRCSVVDQTRRHA